MLRTNLSTRPFYNERAVHVAAGVVAALALAFAAWQAVRIVGFSHQKTELNAAITRDRADTEKNARDAAQIRSKLNQKEVATVAAAAAEANDLIEQRTFSWTQLFNELQSTLPYDVMLTSIKPMFKDGVTTVNFDLQAKSADDVQDFWDHLEKTGAFHDVVWSDLQLTEQGFQKLQMKAVYTSRAASPQTASVPPTPAPEAAPEPNPPSAPQTATSPEQPAAPTGGGRRGRG